MMYVPLEGKMLTGHCISRIALGDAGDNGVAKMTTIIQCVYAMKSYLLFLFAN